MIAEPRQIVTPTLPVVLDTWRCLGCRRILARLRLLAGCTIEIKCKCGQVNILRIDAESQRVL